MLKILPWLPSSLGVKANVLGLPPHPVTSAPPSPAGSRGSHAAFRGLSKIPGRSCLRYDAGCSGFCHHCPSV